MSNSNKGLGLIDPRTQSGGVPFHETQVGSFLINRSGAIIGGLIGGPIGALVGEGVQQVISGCINSRQMASAKGIDLDSQVLYPLTETEKRLIENWLDSQAIPTLQGMLNEADLIIEQNSDLNPTAISSINEILNELGVLLAYKNALVQSSESMRLSKNFIMNKVSVLEFGIESIEKTLMSYLETQATDYKAVYQEVEASSYTMIGTMPLNWTGEQKTQSVQYILKTEEPSDTQTPIDVVTVTDNNTTTGNSGNENTSTDNTITEAKKMNPIVKYVLLMGAGYFFSKAINK